MATKQPHLLFKKTWVDFLKDEFSNDPVQTMQIFFAICDYAYEGKIPDDTALRLAIGTIRKEIDNDRQAYNELSDKRRNVRLEAIEKRKNGATIVDFVEKSEQNQENEQVLSNQTNRTNGTNIIYNNISNSTSSKEDSELQNNKKKKNKKENAVLTPAEEQYYAYMEENFPRVQKMEKPLTYEEYSNLISTFPEGLVLDKLSAMNNKKDLIRSYVSAKDTLRNWCKMEIERNGNNSKYIKPKQDITAAVVEDFFSGM